MYPVHHRRSCVALSLFQACSPKRLHHGRNAQIPADETRRSSLDLLKLVDTVFGMRVVPDCESILHDWSDHGLVAPCFHLR